MSPSTATKSDSSYEASGTETPAQPYRPHLRGTGGAATQVFGVPIFADVPLYQDDLPEKFQQLANQWLKDTINMSSVAARVAHPAYLQIIGMGEKAVPLLLRELERRPSHWFPALTAITGENPIPEEARGRFKEMKEAWLEWGRKNNYI